MAIRINEETSPGSGYIVVDYTGRRMIELNLSGPLIGLEEGGQVFKGR